MDQTAIIADDHRIVAEGLASLLAERGWTVELVNNGAELLSRCAHRQYSVAIVDLSMPNVDGIAVLRAARATAMSTPVLIVSMHSEPEVVRKVLNEGAQGYICKAMAADDLNTALLAVCAGRRYISPSIQLRPAAHVTSALTERELEVVRFLSDGMRVKELAQKLGVSPRTIECHKAAAMQKSNATTTMSMMIALRADGLIP